MCDGLDKQSKLIPYDFTDKRNLSKEQEEDIARKVGGERMKASGAIPGYPSDVVTTDFQIECKMTGGAGIFVTKKMLEKVWEEALGAGRTPLLQLRFDTIKKFVEKDWVLVPFSMAEFLKKEVE